MHIDAPFGRMLTAMVTPFNKDLSVDWPGVERLAQHLADNGHDGIVVNGTTGEAPTTKPEEKDEIIRVVKATVGSKLQVLAGAGDNETSFSVDQAKRAEKAGAVPNKPPRESHGAGSPARSRFPPPARRPRPWKRRPAPE